MKYYFNSAGFARSQDYSWGQITEEGQTRIEKPPIFEQIKVDDLIESENFSVLIYRYKNKSESQLLLLITGLKSNRRDFASRLIHNSLAWIDLETEANESLFRAMTILALKGDLDATIDMIIRESDNQQGFEVLESYLYNFIQTIDIPLENNTPSLDKLIGKDSPDLRQRLIEELENYCLPKYQKSLVVVTSIKSRKSLEKTQVWRGLSYIENEEELNFKDDEKLPKTWEKIEQSSVFSLENFDFDDFLEIINRDIRLFFTFGD